MHKSGHRYGKKDHIALIQANLKEMKSQVDEYLKRSSIDQVPRILNPRHYLILDYMKNMDSSGVRPMENQKSISNLNSEQLRLSAESDCFSPMREDLDRFRKQNHKIIIQKRSKSSAQTEVPCLLPSICNINLQYSIKKRRPYIQRKSLSSTKNYESLQQSQQKSMLQNQKLINSVQLPRNNRQKQKMMLNKSEYNKKGLKWLTIDLTKDNKDDKHESQEIGFLQGELDKIAHTKHQEKIRIKDILVKGQIKQGKEVVEKSEKIVNKSKKQKHQSAQNVQKYQNSDKLVKTLLKSQRIHRRKIQKIIFEPLNSQLIHKKLPVNQQNQQNSPQSSNKYKDSSFKEILSSIKKSTLLSHQELERILQTRNQSLQNGHLKNRSLKKSQKNLIQKQSKHLRQNRYVEYTPWQQNDINNKQDVLQSYLNELL